MESSVLFSGIGVVVLFALTLSLLFAIKGFLSWYRATNYTAMKTQITIYELQKMMASRPRINRK